MIRALSAVILLAALTALGVLPARADIAPTPALNVPAGYTVTALTGAPGGLLYSLGFDIDGALMGATRQPYGSPCPNDGSVAGIPDPQFYRYSNGAFSHHSDGGAFMCVPEDTWVAPASSPFPPGLYTVNFSLHDGVSHWDPASGTWRGWGYAPAGNPFPGQLVGGAFGPGGLLYAMELIPGAHTGDSNPQATGEIVKYGGTNSFSDLVFTGTTLGAPFDYPISAEFGPAAYGANSLWVTNNGSNGNDGSIARFDVTNNSYAVYRDSRPGSHFWREAFAPAGPFKGQLYVINNPKKELDAVSPSGVFTPFAAWSAATTLYDVVASPDGQSLYVLMRDDAAGTASIFRIAGPLPDTTPPAITCGSADGLWHAGNVSIACTASDAGSGLANSADASFTLSTSVPVGSETASAETRTRTVCDRAGNCAIAGPVGGNKIDRKPPTVSITSPTSGPYTLNQRAAASYSCSDGGSGVATCAGSVAFGATLDTASVGVKTFTVAATDGAGNASSISVAYDVTYGVTPRFDGHKGFGKSARVDLALTDASGNNVSSVSVTLTAVALDGAVIRDAFAYRGHLGDDGPGYTLSLRSLAPGSHTLTIAIAGDPLTHDVTFTSAA